MEAGTNETYVRIVGEPFLSRARAYRERYAAWFAAWVPFAEGFGAVGFNDEGYSFTFERYATVPEGWTRLEGRGDKKRSRPKRGHPDLARIDAMRAEWSTPRMRDVYGDEVLFRAEFTDRSGQVFPFQVGGIQCALAGPYVGWAGQAYLGYVPDAEAMVRSFATERPDLIPSDELRSWTMPAGLVRITQAEYELAVAQHKVDRERAAAASPPSTQEP